MRAAGAVLARFAAWVRLRKWQRNWSHDERMDLTIEDIKMVNTSSQFAADVSPFKR